MSAQSAAEDSIIYQSAFSHTLAVYYQQAGDQSAIFNGRLYTGYGFTFKAGIPYFLSGEFRRESLVYDGIKFNDIPLLYDNLLEAIITKDQGYWVQLVNERVGSFNIANHHFIRLVVDSLDRSLSGTGYYEVLYQGHSAVLKKSIKKIKEELSSAEGILRSIDQTDRFYVRMGNAYFPVRTKKEMLTTFSDHRKEIQQFLRKNKLKFRKDKDNTLSRVTAYYDQLTK
ncbi:MAG: hypothetical protein ACHQDF_03245 [Chitinophagales bacterium]